jgi:hypothetical protein
VVGSLLVSAVDAVEARNREPQGQGCEEDEHFRVAAHLSACHRRPGDRLGGKEGDAQPDDIGCDERAPDETAAPSDPSRGKEFDGGRRILG